MCLLTFSNETPNGDILKYNYRGGGREEASGEGIGAEITTLGKEMGGGRPIGEGRSDKENVWLLCSSSSGKASCANSESTSSLSA